MEYGLIGEKLGHSFSKEIHEQIETYNYEIKEIERENLDDFMIKREFKAINVTIPYKEAVIPHLHFISERAKTIGAVNTIVNRDGKLYGYNTDFMGMEALIQKGNISIKDKKVLILGTGGTSKTAKAVAKYLGASEVLTVSRRHGEGVITYEEMYLSHTDADVIINTTPCGMYPHSDGNPADISRFSKLEGVVDAIYNPLRTRLVSSALQRGIKAVGGLYMLVAQAIFAAEKFTGKTYDASLLDKVYNKIYCEKQNIVLIGMPSSGKTTVANELSRLCGRNSADTDSMIVAKSGMEITDIFQKFGEAEFRNRESECVNEASQYSNCIIATGGGAILKKSNVESLRQNGVLYFLDRKLEDLMPTSDRPLASDREAIKKRFEERYNIYIASADVIINVDSDPQTIAERILAIHQNGGVSDEN